MTRTMNTENGTWKVMGLNLTPTDSIYQMIVSAINSNNLEQNYLQDVTGHRAPILVDKKAQTIQFQPW